MAEQEKLLEPVSTNLELSPEATKERILNGELASFEIIVAHPDDELYMLGYVLSSLPSVDDLPPEFQINVHYLTSGEGGRNLALSQDDKKSNINESKDMKKSKLRNRRQIESFRAWETIFGQDIYSRTSLNFYNLKDGGLDSSAELEGVVSSLTKPFDSSNLVFSIDDVEGHVDHRVLANMLESLEVQRIELGAEGYFSDNKNYEEPENLLFWERETTIMRQIALFALAHKSQFGERGEQINKAGDGLVGWFLRYNRFRHIV